MTIHRSFLAVTLLSSSLLLLMLLLSVPKSNGLTLTHQNTAASDDELVVETTIVLSDDIMDDEEVEQGLGGGNETDVERGSLFNPTADAFRRVSPAVVNIVASDRKQGLAAFGTGIIIDEHDGLILTCEHNIEDADPNHIYVLLSDRRVYRANVLGRDKTIDAAVLQLLLDEVRDDALDHVFRYFAHRYEHGMPESIDWTAPLPSRAELGSSKSIQVGMQVLTIGADAERGSEANIGVVNSLEFFRARNGIKYILTDADTYKGYSGGPLVDIKTNTVIGMHKGTLHLSIKKKEYDPEQRNIAVAIDGVKDVLPRMIDGETIQHGSIGEVRYLGLTQDVSMGSLTSGAAITAIESRSRASRAGLRRHDVIVEIGGVEVHTEYDAIKLVDQAPIGKKLEIVVLRNDGKTRKALQMKPYDKAEEEMNKLPLLRMIAWIRDKLTAWIPSKYM